MNMCLNRKRRALSEIRQSNYIRSGGEISNLVKTSNELSIQEEKELLAAERPILSRRLKNKFGNNFIKTKVDSGWMEDDFIRELRSHVITFKLKR